MAPSPCIMFSCRPSVRRCVSACLYPSERDIFMIPEVHIGDFHQTVVSSATWDRDELIRLWGKRSFMRKISFSGFVSAISPVCIDGRISNFCR